MKEISWKEWYDMYKDKQPLNEMTLNYKLYLQQYTAYWGGGNVTYPNFLIQESGDFVLQQNGYKLKL